MKKLFLFLVACLVMQISFGQEKMDSTNRLKVGQDMPEFTLRSIDGKIVTSDDMYGKVVLINFFATWCPPCNKELPLVESDIWAKYKDNKDFMLVIVDREEKSEVVKPFVEKKKWSMPFYLDEKKEVYLKFATKFIPRNYLFDKQSRLILTSMGFKEEEFEVLKKEIADQLKTKL